MSLNAQVSAERVHIGFFGLRNAGKSSLVNRVTGQELSVVSEVRGTTTDPVRKAMELLFGPFSQERCALPAFAQNWFPLPLFVPEVDND